MTTNQNSKSSVVAILYPGCIFFEIALALEILAEKYEIKIATPNGEDHTASNGAVFTNCVSYSKVDLKNCKAVLVPGGDPRSIKDNQDVDLVLRKAHELGLWLAAICAGLSVLAKAKVLTGKRIAHGYGPEQLEFLKSYFEGVHLTDEKFVIDGPLLTAKPEAHIDFAVELAGKLGCVPNEKMEFFKNYYRGTSSVQGKTGFRKKIENANIRIRNATLQDLPRLTEINNHYIVNTNATFDIEPQTAEQRHTWFAKYKKSGPYQLLVAEDGNQIIGYAYSSRYRDHFSFDQTVETSIYLAPDQKSKGLGSLLYEALFTRLSKEKLHLAVVGIALPNEGSIALHKKFGFVEVGVFKEYAIKHGQYISSVWMQKWLGE